LPTPPGVHERQPARQRAAHEEPELAGIETQLRRKRPVVDIPLVDEAKAQAARKSE